MKTCRVQDIFHVNYGNGLELANLQQSPQGVNFIARGMKDNGVSATVKPVLGEKLFPKGVITVAVSGSVMESFLQTAPFYTAYHVMVLTPKSEMTDAEKLYYCHCLRINKFKYSYGRQANETLADLQIPHPSEIPQAIRGFSLKGYEEEIRKAVDIKLPSGQVRESPKEGLVPLGDLFKVVNGIASTGLLRSTIKKNENWIPFIRPSYRQATSIDAYVNKFLVPADKIFPKETLYVSTNGQGSHTYAYVSATEFVPNSDVCVLIPKRDMSLRERLAYSLFITRNRFRFSYGRKPKGDKLKAIMLPATIPEKWNSTDLQTVLNQTIF